MRVTLRNVKNIKELTFEMPGSGLWIVTGTNGSGKTSLFAALYRTKFSNAFPWYFRAGGLSTPVDRYKDAEISYEIDGQEVTYKYGGQRWRASPRKNSNLLDSVGYPRAIYLEANATRVEPYAKEIRSNRVYACKDDLTNFMEYVLISAKWRELKYVYTSRGGRGSVRAFLVQYKVGSRNFYFSEKSFSLGELCVLRVANEILNAPDGSLVLIDEVEMALHPTAQVRMLKKIEEIAAAKNLTVLFSTHSSTLIKSADRKKLIFLRSCSGVVTVAKGAYPAAILGDLTVAGEVGVDFLIFVEDEHAAMLSDELVQRYVEASSPDPIARPQHRIIPVGGYPQVVAQLASTTGLLPNYVNRKALLDEDARTPIDNAIGAHIEPIASQFAQVGGHIGFLPWTPELGLAAFFEDDVVNDDASVDLLRTAFGNGVNFRAIVTDTRYTNITAANPRKQAKKRVSHVAQQVVTAAGASEKDVLRKLYGVLVAQKYANDLGALRALLGPLLRVA